MSIVKGDTVHVHYSGCFLDGTEFDRSPADRPLVFTLGQGQLIAGFEKAVEGREKGDVIQVRIAPEDGYGLHNPALMFQVPASQVPDNLEPEIGALLHVATEQGELEVCVAAMDENFITLDANHPLAGKELDFTITIADIS